MSSLEQIAEQLRLAGHPPLPDGHPRVSEGTKVHRYGKGKKYWYALHEVRNEFGSLLGYAGAYGYWTGDDNNAVPFQWRGEAVSEADLAATRRRQEQAAVEAAERAEKAARNAANRAAEQWRVASTEGVHPYLVSKQITPEAVRFAADGTMYVPMLVYGERTRLVGLQKIAADGQKRFTKGMSKSGTACVLGEVADDTPIIGIGEGYATCRTIRADTDEAFPVCVAFTAGGLLDAARNLRALYPHAHLLFFADDDWIIRERAARHLADDYGYCGGLPGPGEQLTVATKDGEFVVKLEAYESAPGVDALRVVGTCGAITRRRTFENAGVTKAVEAVAQLGNASYVVPLFRDRRPQASSDYSDLHLSEGRDAVAAQVRAALLASTAPRGESSALQSSAPGSSVPDEEYFAPSYAAARDGGASATEYVDNRDWELGLACTDKGKVLPTLGNVHLILSNHNAWSGVIAHDDFAGRVVKRKRPPFAQADVGEWTDMDDIRCVLWLSQKYGISVRQDVVMNAVLLVADQAHFHGVLEYLDGLEWDGVKRLSRWPQTYLHVADSEYVQLVAVKWMIAAVARVMRPGSKVDNVLILEGKQGWGKSTALEVIASKPWYTNSPIRIGDKDTYAVMAGKWIVELAELDALNKADSSAAKSFFATETDRFRNFYGKRATDVHRQGVFAGSVNFDAYLKDESGGRRYWPIACGGPIDLNGLRRDRDQLWAEAVHLFREGVAWHVSEAERPLFDAEQRERYEGDVYEDRIGRAIDALSRITMEEILGDILKLDTSKWTLPEQRRVGKALKSLGWVRKRESGGRRQWFYVPGEDDNLGTAPAGGDAAQVPAFAGGEDDDSPL